MPMEGGEVVDEPEERPRPLQLYGEEDQTAEGQGG